jgi:hypothetical protein
LPLIARVLIADYPEMERLFGRRLLDEILSPQLLQSVLDEVGGLPSLTASSAVEAAIAQPGPPQG